MKNTLLTLIISLAFLSVQAQSKEHKVSKTSGTLVLAGLNEVTVEAYNGSEIIFSTDSYNEDVDERAAGLKLVNALGLNDNTGLGLAVQEENGNIVVSQISSSCDSEFKIKVPSGMSLEYEHKSNSGGDIEVIGLSKEVIISTTYGDVELRDITGPMAVKSVYGSVEAEFSSVSQSGSITIESIYDLVDITLPSNANADISMRTPYGEIYSNVDIEVDKSEGMRRVSSKTIKGTINGGGVDFKVKASYDNIYLRKK